MHPAYEEYFNSQLLEISEKPMSARQQIILQRVVGLIPVSWRPDASYFLAKNIELMVVRPLFQVAVRPEPLAIGRIWQLIERDMVQIIAEAEAEATSRGRGYISATSVSKALGRLADRLETTSFQIWGPQ